MFGLRYIKFDPMDHVIHYRKGRVVRQGAGLSFFYFAPTASIVRVPLGSNDLRFVFNEVTRDFQDVTVQGQLTYRIAAPEKAAALFDLTVDGDKRHRSDAMEKLEQRLISEARTAVSAFIQGRDIQQALISVSPVEQRIVEGLAASKAVDLIGVEVLGVNVFDVKATPEMAKALEARTREALKQQADNAIYERRISAVEQERKVKESELGTEIALEEKQQQIARKVMETEMVKQEKERRIREMAMAADISVEQEREKLIDMRVQNERKEADARGYQLQTALQPLKEMDWRTLMAINTQQADPGTHIALAFRELAENANRIGTLNITPDLLTSILTTKKA